jgi:preprotein translocase subunit SecB
MTTETNGNGNGNGNGGSAVPTQQFLLRQLYIKDMSFESPNSPAVFAEPFNPDVQLNLQTQHQVLSDSNYEVVLQLSAHAKGGERSLFLVELQQAGIFQIAGYNADEISVILGTHCPATLFPYAREAISALVVRGGFPPLLLQPINFDVLYAQAQRNRNLA